MKAVQPAEALVLGSIQIDAAELTADKPTSTIQLSKVGDFKSKRYGKFSITAEHVDKMVENRTKSVNDPPVDYHHLSLSAVLPDQALAAGWIKNLEKRDDNSLWGSVEWTPKAAQHIRDGEFKYISPVILWDAKDEQGESMGATLMSAALTIYPFLQGMAPVALSELQAEGIVAADLSIDQKRGRIAEALRTKDGNSWIRDIFDKFVVYELGSKLYKLGYKVNKKLEVSFDGEPEEVVPQYVPLTSPDGGIKPMAEEKKPEPNADVVKLQSDFAALQTQLTDTVGKMTALTTQLEEERTTSKKLRDDITKTRAEAGVSALIRQGKIVPAQKEKMVELAIKDPIFFEEFIKTLPVVVKLSKNHGTNEGDEEAAKFGDEGNDPIKLFDDKVAEWQEKNAGKTIGDAIKAVDKANPGLYEQRRLAYAVKTAVNGSVGDVQ
jgi:phage I-like protein